jgi:hypothetical protein
MISKLLALLFLHNYDVISDLIYIISTPLVNKPLMYPILIASLLAAPVIVCLVAIFENKWEREGAISGFFGL